MAVELMAEDELRAALEPYRVDPQAFAAAVANKLKVAAAQPEDPLADWSPALRSAAAFLPLEIVGTQQWPTAALKLAPAAGGYKLLSYLALPAISLFVLLGATVFGVKRIRRLHGQPQSASVDEQAMPAAVKAWWQQHKFAGVGVFAASMAMGWYGATWLLFLCYIVSLGVLIFVLHSLAKRGLGNRQLVGQSCLMALIFLGQIAGFPGIGDQDIHFLDPTLLVPWFFFGALVIVAILLVSRVRASAPTQRAGQARLAAGLGLGFAALVVPFSIWYSNAAIWPATPERIKAYVESFDRAPFSSASWLQWEIPASWVVDTGLHPDFARPRRLLDAEIAGKQNPFILGTAFRVGLIEAGQLDALKDYAAERKRLLDRPVNLQKTQIITSLDQKDWVIRAALMRDDLSQRDRDFLAQRLRATLDASLTGRYAELKTPLRVTQLLAAIGRPLDPAEYRERIHAMLLEFHSTQGGGFQAAGGFKEYDVPETSVGSLSATSSAVELMQFYGIPHGLDVNWVRSYLRPRFLRIGADKWTAAATRARLNALPGITQPTLVDWLYYERSMLAAIVLVAMCIYATASSPMPRVVNPNGPSEN